MSKNPFFLFGNDLFGDPVKPSSSGAIAARFTLPPFSVLDTRQGAWQDRKRAWLSLGIKSEIGRGTTTMPSGTQRYHTASSPNAMAMAGGFDDSKASGASVFDPVLCELAYRWFAPPAGLVLDPFAGGSVRGIVASLLGYRYVGVDLRREQISANREQAKRICQGAPPDWIEGDSRDLLSLAPEQADFMFSCPPYGDLERYSDDPRDLSTLSYTAFSEAYRTIVAASIARLRADRFACFVVGDIRCPRGFYRNFTGETVAAFEAAGARYYNEGILITPLGSLPIRIGKQFSSGRKFGKTHQNVLVFCKGDPKRAAEACGKLEGNA